MKIVRYLSWYDKVTEIMVGELFITNIDIIVLKRIFNPPKDDPKMYYMYDVGKKEAAELNKYIEYEFNFEDYDYDFGCYQDK